MQFTTDPFLSKSRPNPTNNDPSKSNHVLVANNSNGKRVEDSKESQLMVGKSDLHTRKINNIEFNGNAFGQPTIVTKENFEEIKEKLQTNCLNIISLEIRFILTEEQLGKLFTMLTVSKVNQKLGFIHWHKNQPADMRKALIETQLHDNNWNYRYFPNDYMYALLSTHSYVDSKIGDKVALHDVKLENKIKEELLDWRVIIVHNDTKYSGYYGVVYQNDKTHQIVLANRGTEGGALGIITDAFRKKSDWNTNLKETLVGQIVVGQQGRNYQATAEAIEIAKKTGYQLSFTGHSLGAWLAELSLFYSYSYFNERRTKAVTFDSPGSAPMMEKLQSNIKNNDTQIDLHDLELTSYLAMPNLVNCCNPHVGKVYRIAPEMQWLNWSNNKIPSFIKTSIGGKIQGVLSCEGHTLMGILDTFNPKTGKPNTYQRMADWPRMQYNGNEKDFSSAKGSLLKNILQTIGIPWPVAKVSEHILNWVVGDGTLVTMIDFLLNLSKIDQVQYWTYFQNKDIESLEEGNLELRRKLEFDKEFALLAKGKYRTCEDTYVMNLSTASIDKFLYKIYAFKNELVQNEDLNLLIKDQLEVLANSFTINNNGRQYILTPKNGMDVEIIKQVAQRFLEVMPKNMHKAWKEGAIVKKEIVPIFIELTTPEEKEPIKAIERPQLPRPTKMAEDEAILFLDSKDNVNTAREKLICLLDQWPATPSSNCLKILWINELKNGITLELPGTCSNLTKFTIGKIFSDSLLKFPSTMNSLSTLTVGNVWGSIGFPNKCDTLATITLGNIWGIIGFPSRCDALTSLLLGNIRTSINIQLPLLPQLINFTVGELFCNDNSNNSVLQFPSSLDSVQTITVGCVHDNVKLKLADSHKNLTTFSVQLIGKNASIELPDSLNKLQFLRIGTIEYNAKFNLPKVLNGLIKFKINYISNAAIFNLSSQCNSLKEITIDRIWNYAEFKITNLCNNITSLTINHMSTASTLEINTPLNSLEILNIGDIEEKVILKLPNILPNLKTLKYEYDKDKRNIEERLPLIFLKFKLDIINLSPNFAWTFLFLIFAAYYYLG